MIRVDTLFRAVSRDPQAAAVGANNGHQWCHLWCDEGEEEQLHEIAKAIGMQRRWFQNKKGFPHYDLVPNKRIRAIREGAVETDLAWWLRARRLSQLRGELVG